MLRKTAEKKYSLSLENASKEFDRIVEAFGFNISTEARERIVKMKINSIDMETSQELSDADAMVQKIREGRIKFDEEKTEIVYVLPHPIKTGEGGAVSTPEIRFGEFTRAKQKAVKAQNAKGNSERVQLNEMNFGTMDDDKQDAVLMAMTGISDYEILNKLTITAFNDLRMIAGYFFL